jgi:hypothetical protein
MPAYKNLIYYVYYSVFLRILFANNRTCSEGEAKGERRGSEEKAKTSSVWFQVIAATSGPDKAKKIRPKPYFNNLT